MIFDLAPYKRISVEPLTGSLGAEVFGVDVTRLDEQTFAEIHAAFLAHMVLVFRDQHLDPPSLSAFGERFGPLSITPHIKPQEGWGLVTRIERKAETSAKERNSGDEWHGDQSPRERPNMGAALYCVECPPYGGDTLFSNLCMAYDDLSPALKQVCGGLVGLHSRSGLHGTDGEGHGGKRPLFLKDHEGRYQDEFKSKEAQSAYLREVMEHPLVRTHPETGKPILYLAGPYLTGLKGMSDLESKPLIEQLQRHAQRPEFFCRVRWKPGTLLLWDNRCCQHYAVNDYEGFARRMIRVEMEGERPFGPAMPRKEEAARRPATADAV